ncbi:hypothetical protein JIN85_19115 [Luteolibacter pohnpeiensis]|uniref:Lipoprotein n=1 Tax=Luteolibacter pohnpeiensis TaxID=454153 RepID=A0A934SAR1_9BACT|nr:hypothetical protein [Luteolibacter pohnpeiensis]MBK1884535.1 hypothetical protein [Luteolibacter pohnpeiensis]
MNMKYFRQRFLTMKGLALSLLFSTSLFVSCSKTPPPVGSGVEQIVRGEWGSERTYTNDFFGVSLGIPSEWPLLKGDEENLAFMLKSIRVAAGGDRSTENAFREQFKNIHVPMRALELPDRNDTKNPNVLVMIENIETDPSIKTGGDFLKKMEKFMNSNPEFPKFDGPPTLISINGVDCWTRSSTYNVNGGDGILFSGAGGYTVRQQGYSIVKGHFALTILSTWFSSSDNLCSDFVYKHLAKLEKPGEHVSTDRPAAASETQAESSEIHQHESKPVSQ